MYVFVSFLGTRTDFRRDALEDEFPYQCMLLLNFADEGEEPVWEQKCGCSILTDKWIVTATHCLLRASNQERRKKENLKVSYGTNVADLESAPRHSIDDIILHDDYIRSTKQNDIALISVIGTIAINGKSVQAIELSQEKVVPDTMLLMCRFQPQSW